MQQSEQKVPRAAIYIRVSTAEQVVHGKSLEAQTEHLQRYAEEHGMRVIGIYADEGQTARKELKKRKAIHRLLESVKRDEVDVILFWRMDRWFRSVSDFYKVQDVLDAHGTRWISTSEPNINMETRDGRLNLNLVLTIGQNEVDTTSERIRFTVDSMIRNGRVVWGEKNVPLGYAIEMADGQKKMVKKASEAPMVEEFYRYFLKHQNKSRTVRHMQETFGISFSYSMLKTMLTSEFYIGKYRDNLNYCPAYLTKEEWADIQKCASRNVKTAPSGRIYYFSGLIRCPLCGQRLCGTGTSMISNRKTGEKRIYSYYRCNHAIIDHICTYRHRLSQNLLEKFLLENLFRAYQEYQMKVNQISARAKAKKNTRTEQQIRAEMNRLNQMFLKMRISEADYDAEYLRLEKELNAALLLPSEDTSGRNARMEQLRGLNLSEMYDTLTPENKQAFWRSILREIHIDAESHQVTAVDFL